MLMKIEALLRGKKESDGRNRIWELLSGSRTVISSKIILNPQSRKFFTVNN